MTRSRCPLFRSQAIRRVMRGSLPLLCLGFIAWPNRPAQSAVPYYSIEDLTLLATNVVEATVNSETSAWEPWLNGGQVILSTLTVDVIVHLKGSGPPVMDVIFPGGTVGETHMTASCAPTLDVGETAVLFLREDPAGGRWFILGLERGVFNVDREGLAVPQAADMPVMPLTELEAEIGRIVRAEDGSNR